MKRLLLLVVFKSVSPFTQAQELSNILSLQEYLTYVKRFHPIVKQADLIIDESEASLLRSRGAFDPKLEIDYDRKQFKGTNYFNKLNTTFKIPTWYGIEFKANFEENSGFFLNPEANVPGDGLYSVGVTVSLARGMLMNERMSMLRRAKYFKEQARADRQLLVNQILYDASRAYFQWLRMYNEKQIYYSFLKNAELRLKGVKKSFQEGELAAIDTLEAGITVNNRKLQLESSKIKLLKTTLELSNFLWLKDNTPMELQDDVIPDLATVSKIDRIYRLNTFQLDSVEISQHPKMISLENKFQGLKVDKKLKANRLLPQVDLEYNFLTETPTVLNSFDQNQYKGGVKVRLPLFLRKERGDLQLSKLKLKDIRYQILDAGLNLNNKIKAVSNEINSLERQTGYAEKIVRDYHTLLKAEERKFYLGESSIFLVNSRESKLIDSKLKKIKVQNDYLNSKVELINVLAPAN